MSQLENHEILDYVERFLTQLRGKLEDQLREFKSDIHERVVELENKVERLQASVNQENRALRKEFEDLRELTWKAKAAVEASKLNISPEELVKRALAFFLSQGSLDNAQDKSS